MSNCLSQHSLVRHGPAPCPCKGCRKLCSKFLIICSEVNQHVLYTAQHGRRPFRVAICWSNMFHMIYQTLSDELAAVHMHCDLCLKYDFLAGHFARPKSMVTLVEAGLMHVLNSFLTLRGNESYCNKSESVVTNSSVRCLSNLACMWSC